jgi:hypothetical protein
VALEFSRTPIHIYVCTGSPPPADPRRSWRAIGSLGRDIETGCRSSAPRRWPTRLRWLPKLGGTQGSPTCPDAASHPAGSGADPAAAFTGIKTVWHPKDARKLARNETEAGPQGLDRPEDAQSFPGRRSAPAVRRSRRHPPAGPDPAAPASPVCPCCTANRARSRSTLGRAPMPLPPSRGSKPSGTPRASESGASCD